MKKFTESHEWIYVEGRVGTIGITNYAQNELGEVVFVELPTIGERVDAGDEIAVLESKKAASQREKPSLRRRQKAANPQAKKKSD